MNNSFVVIVELARGGLKDHLDYTEDKTFAKAGQLGEKLPTAPLHLNIPVGRTPIDVIGRDDAMVQGGRNLYMKFVYSFPNNVIKSPHELYRTIDRHLMHMSKAAYVTTDDLGGNGNKRRKEKKLRQQKVDLRDLPMSLSIHWDTDNIHAHVVIGLVHPIFREVVRMSNGHVVLACAYARERVLIEDGVITPENANYRLNKDTLGRYGVVSKRIEAKAAQIKAKQQEKAFEETGSNSPQAEPVSETKNPGPYRHRTKQRNGKYFKQMISESYPQGPLPPNSLSPEQQTVEREKLNRNLEAYNLCIKPGEHGGLVLMERRECLPMRMVDSRWTKEAVEALTGLSGRWTLGLPAAEQWLPLALLDIDDRLWPKETMVYRYLQGLAATPNQDVLPWAEYRVKLMFTRSQKQLRMTAAETGEYAQKYLAAMLNHDISNWQVREFRHCNVILTPSLPEGRRVMVIERVPEANLEKAKALHPNLIMSQRLMDPAQKTELPQKTGFYTVVYTVAYHPDNRWQGGNAMALVAQELVQELGAMGAHFRFYLPGVPLFQLNETNCWLLPEIAGPTHTRVSEVLQARMAPAWEQLVEAEKKRAMEYATQLARTEGVHPDMVYKGFAADSPHRKPLLPVDTSKVEAEVKAELKKTDVPNNLNKPALGDEEDEKRRKRELRIKLLAGSNILRGKNDEAEILLHKIGENFITGEIYRQIWDKLFGDHARLIQLTAFMGLKTDTEPEWLAAEVAAAEQELIAAIEHHANNDPVFKKIPVR